MPTYFKPLRRKTGVITLVIACVFMAGWVRSQGRNEQLSMNWGNRWQLHVAGLHGSFILAATEGPQSGGWYSLLPASKNAIEELRCYDWHQIGILWIANDEDRVNKNQLLLIPYWSIVIPLTLLSAWLLLSKLRAQKPPTESPPRAES